MNRHLPTLFVVSLTLVSAGCARKLGPASALKPTGFGAALVESSGGKQIGATGMVLAQPLVVQVNDEQGTAVTGALVEFSGPAGASFDPPSGLTDSSGQLSTNVVLGGMAGDRDFAGGRPLKMLSRISGFASSSCARRSAMIPA